MYGLLVRVVQGDAGAALWVGTSGEPASESLEVGRLEEVFVFGFSDGILLSSAGMKIESLVQIGICMSICLEICAESS